MEMVCTDLPEATSQAYKHFATEYGPVTEIVRKEDPLLMRAAGGTDAVLRYAWKLQSKFKKKRWADSARTVSRRKDISLHPFVKEKRVTGMFCWLGGG